MIKLSVYCEVNRCKLQNDSPSRTSRSTEACQNLRKIRRMHGPLVRYVKLRVAHAQGMPGTFSLPSRVTDPNMHHGTCVTHVPRCMLAVLNSGFL